MRNEIEIPSIEKYNLTDMLLRVTNLLSLPVTLTIHQRTTGVALDPAPTMTLSADPTTSPNAHTPERNNMRKINKIAMDIRERDKKSILREYSNHHQLPNHSTALRPLPRATLPLSAHHTIMLTQIQANSTTCHQRPA